VLGYCSGLLSLLSLLPAALRFAAGLLFRRCGHLAALFSAFRDALLLPRSRRRLATCPSLTKTAVSAAFNLHEQRASALRCCLLNAEIVRRSGASSATIIRTVRALHRRLGGSPRRVDAARITMQEQCRHQPWVERRLTQNAPKLLAIAASSPSRASNQLRQVVPRAHSPARCVRDLGIARNWRCEYAPAFANTKLRTCAKASNRCLPDQRSHGG
jgi:hypothetical protein